MRVPAMAQLPHSESPGCENKAKSPVLGWKCTVDERMAPMTLWARCWWLLGRGGLGSWSCWGQPERRWHMGTRVVPAPFLGSTEQGAMQSQTGLGCSRRTVPIHQESLPRAATRSPPVGSSASSHRLRFPPGLKASLKPRGNATGQCCHCRSQQLTRLRPWASSWPKTDRSSQCAPPSEAVGLRGRTRPATCQDGAWDAVGSDRSAHPQTPPRTESCRSPLLWGFGVLAAREQGVMVVCVPTRRDKTQPRMDL